MKTNCWLVLGAMLASGAIAQDNTNNLPEMPAPVASPSAEAAPAVAPAAAPAPAKPARPARPVRHKRHAAAPKKIKMAEPSVALTPGPAEVTVSNLIVRGQAGLKGEVIAHLFLGDAVTVLGQINLDRHAPDEPAQWAKISYPTNAHVWVNTKYIDEANKVISAKKLNLRAGPGENFSVVGVLEKGAPVSEVETRGNWTKIEAPTNAYAFVAATYLKQEAPAPAETETAMTPPPTPTPVPETQPIVTAPPVAPPEAAPVPAPAPETVAVENNAPAQPRVASHEGVVRHVGSLITPTEYELYDPTTDQNIDFLNTTTTNLQFNRYVGMRIIVSGEEDLAKRWQDIPVLTVDSIQVIDSNAVPQRTYYSPRQSQNH